MFASSFWTAHLQADAVQDRAGGECAFSLSVDVQRRRRDWADALLYDLARLGARARTALQQASAADCALAVAHPAERKPLNVYSDPERWALSLDRDARILALVSPGSSLEASAAFAQQTADALGEPVLGLAPPRGLEDLTADLSAPLSRGAAAGSGAPTSTARRAGLDRIFQAGRREFDLVVSHRLGGRWLCDGACPRLSRIVTVGGAAAPTDRPDALHLMGAQDWYGWSISDTAHLPLRVAPFAGGHLNPTLPGAFPYPAALREAAADLGVL